MDHSPAPMYSAMCSGCEAEKEAQLGNIKLGFAASGTPSQEWERAQAIVFSVTPDLVSAAKQEIKFLAAVSKEPALLKKGPVLDHAIARYEKCWLPMLASHIGSPVDDSDSTKLLLAPFDCAWVWHCHRLNPVQYAQDCQRLFGKLLGVLYIEPSKVSAASEATAQLWAKHYPEEEYHPKLSATPEDATNTLHTQKKQIAYDLVDAVMRQSKFHLKVSAAFWMEDEYLKRAEQRYKGFLHMCATSHGRLSQIVPTIDIDLMWHTHQLDVAAYHNDTRNVLGYVMNHNDDLDAHTVEGAEGIKQKFHETKGLWKATFAMPYDDDTDIAAAMKQSECFDGPQKRVKDQVRTSNNYDGAGMKQSDCSPAVCEYKAHTGSQIAAQAGMKQSDCSPAVCEYKAHTGSQIAAQAEPICA